MYTYLWGYTTSHWEEIVPTSDVIHLSPVIWASWFNSTLPPPLTSNLEACIHTCEVIPPAIEKKSSPPVASSICPQLYELAGSTLLSSIGANSSSIHPKSSTGAFFGPPNFRAPLWGLTEVFVFVWTDKSCSLPHPQSSDDFVLDICDDCWGLAFAVSDFWTLNWLWNGKRFWVSKLLKMYNHKKCTRYFV